MLLYHGSNVIVSKPSLAYSRNNLGFGKGFYLTSDYDQAAKWAARATRLRATGAPVVCVYEADTSSWGKFSEEIAIQLLLPQKLKDQYAFKTTRAIETISFVKAVEA